LLLALAWLLPLEAHKPITSPFTFAEDVAPILRDRCVTCHVAGGPAPMPLTTAEETVPWGESIRLELVSGHMPPWSAMSGGKRLRHAEGLSARELNVLLTWVTGGNPMGSAESTPPAVEPQRGWRLGQPDVVMPMPSEFTIAADTNESVQEFTLPVSATEARLVRAVDLMPGNPAIVRSATVRVKKESPAGAEGVLAVWVPGDAPAAEEHLQVRNATVIDVAVWPRQLPAMRIRREVAQHVLVHQYLQVYAEMAIGADDHIGANAAIVGDVAHGIRDPMIGAVVGFVMRRSFARGLDQIVGEVAGASDSANQAQGQNDQQFAKSFH